MFITTNLNSNFLVVFSVVLFLVDFSDLVTDAYPIIIDTTGNAITTKVSIELFLKKYLILSNSIFGIHSVFFPKDKKFFLLSQQKKSHGYHKIK